MELPHTVLLFYRQNIVDIIIRECSVYCIDVTLSFKMIKCI